MTLGPRQTAVSEIAAKRIQDQLSLQADLVIYLLIVLLCTYRVIRGHLQ